MKWGTGSWRVWLFRCLVAAVAGLMVASFVNLWWICHVTDESLGRGLLVEARMHAYGLSYPSLASEVPYDYTAGETPFYQTVLAWIYLAASVGLGLGSTWLKGGKSKWLLGGIGLIYIAYAAIAVIQIVIRTGDLGIIMQGRSVFVAEGFFLEADASLRFGYYLAYASGGMFIALALLRDKILGKPQERISEAK